MPDLLLYPSWIPGRKAEFPQALSSDGLDRTSECPIKGQSGYGQGWRQGTEARPNQGLALDFRQTFSLDDGARPFPSLPISAQG